MIPRTEAQREHVVALRLPSVIVPAHAVDAQSLIALADLAVSAGGTMNREAVALGTPVYTTYGGRLGGVDEQLIRTGRLRPLTDERAIEVVKQRERAHDRAARSGRADRHDPRSGRVTRAAATPTMSQTAHETLVERYARMAHTFQPRPVDRVLRVLDRVLAAVGLVVTAPLMALCALAVRLSGSRGVLYRGARVGQGGEIFTMIKFRTLEAAGRDAHRAPTTARS